MGLIRSFYAAIFIFSKGITNDLSPKFPPALRGVLGVNSVTSGGHFVHRLSLQEFHWRQVA